MREFKTGNGGERVDEEGEGRCLFGAVRDGCGGQQSLISRACMQGHAGERQYSVPSDAGGGADS